MSRTSFPLLEANAVMLLIITINTGSILNLSNTGGGGRGSDEGDIVGTVILHGKFPPQYFPFRT
jgi:hypothetical protein